MPAHSDTFPWPSYYGNFNQLESILRGHDKVAELRALGGGLYRLTRQHGDKLILFICECYSFGAAEFFESEAELGKLDAVLVNSNWCSYTYEVKRICRNKKIGVFNVAGLMGALNKPDFWTYLDKDDFEVFKKNGWL